MIMIKMITTYTYRSDTKEIQISFNLESDETDNEKRDVLAETQLSKILKEDIAEGFYLDDVIERKD